MRPVGAPVIEVVGRAAWLDSLAGSSGMRAVARQPPENVGAVTDRTAPARAVRAADS